LVVLLRVTAGILEPLPGVENPVILPTGEAETVHANVVPEKLDVRLVNAVALPEQIV
jgi:hypothetical protein